METTRTSTETKQTAAALVQFLAALDESLTAPARPKHAPVAKKPAAAAPAKIHWPELVDRRGSKYPGKADIVPGKSIRLYGTEANRVNGPQTYDITFKLGDGAVYGGYNFRYTGKITAIGPKTVTITDCSKRVHRLDLYSFSFWNWNYDADRIAKERADWYD